MSIFLLFFFFFSWFLQTAEAFNPLISVELLLNIVFLACLVFQFDMVNIIHYYSNYFSIEIFSTIHQQTKHLDFGIVSILLDIPLGMSILFVYCFFGKMATESYKNMSKCLCECNWQDLSLQHQKYFLIMIQNTQQPLYYHGFGIAILDLETFTDVKETIHYISLLFYSFNGLIISFSGDSGGVFILHDLQNSNKQLNDF